MIGGRKVWAVGGSTVLLGLLFGVLSLEGANERAMRSQRVRSNRMARPDYDHELADHSHDWFLGRGATSLNLQVAPDKGSHPQTAVVTLGLRPATPIAVTFGLASAGVGVRLTTGLYRDSFARPPPAAV